MPTAAVIMDGSAALLNDVAKTNFTYAAQLPYLNIALKELKENLQQNNVPYTNRSNTSVVITAGATILNFSSPSPLPMDLIEIQEIFERDNGVTEDFIPMRRVEFLPPQVIPTQCLIYWAWINQEVRFIGATTDRQLRIDYIADPFVRITDSAQNINFFNSDNFLTFRTAALCAQFIGENKERSDDLNVMAQLAIDRVNSIASKGKQAIMTRRRPFMSSFKMRSGY